jgi:hypothetical protein
MRLNLCIQDLGYAEGEVELVEPKARRGRAGKLKGRERVVGKAIFIPSRLTGAGRWASSDAIPNSAGGGGRSRGVIHRYVSKLWHCCNVESALRGRRDDQISLRWGSEGLPGVHSIIWRLHYKTNELEKGKRRRG